MKKTNISKIKFVMNTLWSWFPIHFSFKEEIDILWLIKSVSFFITYFNQLNIAVLFNSKKISVSINSSNINKVVYNRTFVYYTINCNKYNFRINNVVYNTTVVYYTVRNYLNLTFNSVKKSNNYNEKVDLFIGGGLFLDIIYQRLVVL
jgi:hypothetical protein